uniref:Uncharacterized protein n=1 Tax=Sinocyclocheilus grahami TaxID=75366 RepID=A0A672NGI9_SINGR
KKKLRRERLADNVTPLWRMSYEEQSNILLEMTKQLFPPPSIVASPVSDGYHNKSTFSVNRGVDGNPKTAGFYIGNGKTDNIDCVQGDHLLNMSSKHKMIARHYEDFIRPRAVCQLDSLYFQETTMTRCSHEQSPYQLLHGQSHIFEEVLGFGEVVLIFQFLSGKAEVVLPNLMATLNCDGGLTAGLNPSRAAIRRLVYISRKPDGEAMRNFRGLCCSSDYKTPTIAVPVDLFPHTPHCELVLVFER